jgi:hypothetical protein
MGIQLSPNVSPRKAHRVLVPMSVLCRHGTVSNAILVLMKISTFPFPDGFFAFELLFLKWRIAEPKTPPSEEFSAVRVDSRFTGSVQRRPTISSFGWQLVIVKTREHMYNFLQVFVVSSHQMDPGRSAPSFSHHNTYILFG